MTLGKQAACLRTVGDRNPDPKIAALEEEFIELGNNIGMGPMGFVGKSMVVDCHIEVGYCHTGGMPMSVHAFCLSSRRARSRASTLTAGSNTAPTRIGSPPICAGRQSNGRKRRQAQDSPPEDAGHAGGLLRGSRSARSSISTASSIPAARASTNSVVEDGSTLPDGPRRRSAMSISIARPPRRPRTTAAYKVGAVTATASFRFAKWLDDWFAKSGAKVIIGKGGMSARDYQKQFVPIGAVYLTTVGYGTGALLGRGITGVKRRAVAEGTRHRPGDVDVRGREFRPVPGRERPRGQQPVRAREREDRARTCRSSMRAPGPPSCAATARRTTGRRS